MKFLYKIILPVILFVSVSLVLASNSNETAHSLTNSSITNQQSNRADLTKLKKEIDREIGKPRALTGVSNRLVLLFITLVSAL